MINQDNNLILDGVRTMPTQNQDYSNDLGFAGNQNSQILGTVGNSARTLNYRGKHNGSNIEPLSSHGAMDPPRDDGLTDSERRQLNNQTLITQKLDPII